MCNSEEEARQKMDKVISNGQWPCLFTTSNTTGEKDFEEFYTDNEVLDLDRFHNLGIVKSELNFEESLLSQFENKINKCQTNGYCNKEEIVTLFQSLLPTFDHKETGKYLDGKM
jgi:hypothetical protein